MVYLFFFGFILIFGAGYFLAGALAIWTVVTMLALLLNKLLSLFSFNFRKTKSITQVSTKKANLEDPIGAMCVVAQKYNDLLFLKDIAFLEVQLFGQNSDGVIDQIRAAEADPRPEVCGSCANKMLLSIGQERSRRLKDSKWSTEQEELWERGTPKEWRIVINQFSKAS